ncbi:hypothetical protein HPB51_018766 [Rhipicephalus microplus]|uniref:Uncharacterized protein n=1 Tax=Rhipicephalus microplus TaxID=6941 RepID=A0A9J6DI78_RHIMP|nr:hypothetical protein HPB51_018766 [Rhipicephalus microplus]
MNAQPRLNDRDADGTRGKATLEAGDAPPSKQDDVPAQDSTQDDDTDSDYLCGVGNYRPNWLQRFATSRYYALVFGLLGIFQGAFRTYLVGTLSTVERRFFAVQPRLGHHHDCRRPESHRGELRDDGPSETHQ